MEIGKFGFVISKLYDIVIWVIFLVLEGFECLFENGGIRLELLLK